MGQPACKRLRSDATLSRSLLRPRCSNYRAHARRFDESELRIRGQLCGFTHSGSVEYRQKHAIRHDR